MTRLNIALKEWSVAVDTLCQGDTILLLRKGGIREHQGSFTVTQDQVLLYPTHEHQKADGLKPEYAKRLPSQTMMLPPPAPRPISLQAWAHITDVLPIATLEQGQALFPFHIWTTPWVTERWGWKPQSPLYALLLRTYRLDHPLVIPFEPQYGGCRSWITLTTTIDMTKAIPVLSEDEYEARAHMIRARLTLD